jgi:hypothetical protein
MTMGMKKDYEPLLVELEAMKKSVTDWGTLALMLKFLAYERLLNSGITKRIGTSAENDVRFAMNVAGKELVELIVGDRSKPAPLDLKGTVPPEDQFEQSWPPWMAKDPAMARIKELERRVASLEAWAREANWSIDDDTTADRAS